MPCRVALLVAVAILSRAAWAEPAANPWAEVSGTSAGKSEAIGGYSAGCLAGGVDLATRGKGFRVMKPGRGRHFTHEVTAQLISDLGAELAGEKLGYLPLGDLSQARGGPAPTGHSSHQTGLDVDIWYAASQGKRHAPVMMVDGKRKRTTKAFGRRERRILALVVADPRVDRIFVNPVLKRALCQAKGEHGWLHKLRPWWGHDDHFHVRLACPRSDADCTAQAAIPEGDGCDELDWWFADHAEGERTTKHENYQAQVGALPTLPDRCAALVP